MSTTPRVRPELQATAVEEQGIKYYDVNDPKSGASMRMYDFEWLVAQRMDGARPFEELASWAHERLGIHPSASDLQHYAETLRDLGFIETDEDYTPLPVAVPASDSMLGGNGRGDDLRAQEVQFEEDMPTTPRIANASDIEMSRPEPLSPAPATAAPERPRMAEPPARVGTPPQRKSSMGSIIALVLVALAIGAGLVYVQVILPNQAVKVSVLLASPREVVRLYDGAAAMKKSEPQALSFGENGKITDVVAQGTEAKAGMPLATLESFGKIGAEITGVKDRLAFYEKQLAAAKAKGDEHAATIAEGKVKEKKTLHDALEVKAAKSRITAPGTGTVTEVLATAGSDVKAGQPIVKIGDKRTTAEFKIPAADAAALKPGAAVSLAPAAGGATLPGRVVSVEGETVSVEALEEASVKPGDSLRLVRAKLQNVVKVPATSVSKREGTDLVFVLTNGEARARKITIVDRDGADVLVGSGLAAGDSVITSNVEQLVDGKKAATQQ